MAICKCTPNQRTQNWYCMCDALINQSEVCLHLIQCTLQLSQLTSSSIISVEDLVLSVQTPLKNILMNKKALKALTC